MHHEIFGDATLMTTLRTSLNDRSEEDTLWLKKRTQMRLAYIGLLRLLT